MLNFKILILQISIILVITKFFHLLFKKICQPQVIGEMVAGVVLGPSVLGWFFPHVFQELFPSGNQSALYALGYIGITIYLFLVGLELDPKVFRKHLRSAVVIAPASIIVPFFLGAGLSFYLHPGLLNKNVDSIHFALFLGTVFSVTAFPVLVRILSERDMLHSEIGIIAIACAALVDAIVWYLLAFVVLIARASFSLLPFLLTICGLAIYVFFMFFIVRRLLVKLEKAYRKTNDSGAELLLVIFLVLLTSALITEWLNIHAVFGAFLAGVVMPKEEDFVQALKNKLETLITVLLLPLFFAGVGLRTRIDLINWTDLWAYCVLIIIVAVIGKFGVSTVLARFTGIPWREAGAIGILMNTRGLMELIVLNIGLEIGIISPTLFVILVIMTIITTIMTTPILKWIYPSPAVSSN